MLEVGRTTLTTDVLSGHAHGHPAEHKPKDEEIAREVEWDFLDGKITVFKTGIAGFKGVTQPILGLGSFDPPEGERHWRKIVRR